MTVLKGANVTKFDAGGSGDNYIEDGYIKSVEKVWIDSYTATAVALGTSDTIKIGRVPKNKKITDIIVHWPVAGGAADSLATIFVGSASTVLATTANTYLGSLQQDGMAPGTTTFNIATVCTLRLSGNKFATVTDKDVDIYLRVVQANKLPLVLTGWTLTTIIKYT